MAEHHPASTMAALYAEQRGGPETLRYGVLPTPAAGDDEVLVEVHAAAITFAELTWDETWQRRPTIVSHEISGVVADVGRDAAQWSPGDEVYALIRFDRQGGAAGYATVPALDLARRPTTVGHDVAAAVPLAGLTAWQALVDHARVGGGDRVLVHGGAGGVGAIAVQLALRLGATVTATGRRSHLSIMRSLGVHRAIDVDAERFDEDLQIYDVVIDTVSGETLDRSYPVLRPGGRLVTLTAPPDRARAAEFGVDATFFVVTPDRAQLDELSSLVDAGDLVVQVAALYPLSEGQAAFVSGERPNRRAGKTVLSVRDG